MPEPQITNPAGAYGEDVLVGQRTLPMVNGSTSTITAYSLVSLSTAGGATTAAINKKFVSPALTLANVLGIGIVQKDVDAGASGPVCIEGYSLVAISSDGVPAVGDLLSISTVASVSTGTNTPVTSLVKTSTGIIAGSFVGIAMSTALDSYTTTSTALSKYVLAYIHKF